MAFKNIGLKLMFREFNPLPQPDLVFRQVGLSYGGSATNKNIFNLLGHKGGTKVTKKKNPSLTKRYPCAPCEFPCVHSG